MRRLKFYHAYKWYMQKSESVQENETIKIFTMLTSGICKNQNLSKRMRRLKFYHAYKWYMQKSESVQENEMIKILSCLQVVYAKIRICPREWDD